MDTLAVPVGGPPAPSQKNGPHRKGSAAAAVAAALAAVAAAEAAGVQPVPLDHNAGGAPSLHAANIQPALVPQQRLPPMIVDLDDTWPDLDSTVGPAPEESAAAGVEVCAKGQPVSDSPLARAGAAAAAAGGNTGVRPRLKFGAHVFSQASWR
jgi:hypothetical protein